MEDVGVDGGGGVQEYGGGAKGDHQQLIEHQPKKLTMVLWLSTAACEGGDDITEAQRGCACSEAWQSGFE